MKTTRREFLKLGVGIGGLALVPGIPVKAEPKPDPLGEWLECDGSEFLIEELPELHSVIGSAYGGQRDELTGEESFRIPDLRMRLEARPRNPYYANSPMESVTVDGLTRQPTSTALRYLIKAKHGVDTGTSDPFGEVPIGTIIASL